jgi:hypothetical protein
MVGPNPPFPDPGAPIAAGRVFHPDMSGHNPTDADDHPRIKHSWRYNLLGALILLLFFLVLAAIIGFVAYWRFVTR